MEFEIPHNISSPQFQDFLISPLAKEPPICAGLGAMGVILSVLLSFDVFCMRLFSFHFFPHYSLLTVFPYFHTLAVMTVIQSLVA